jgi:rhodanese-related sulfurtransferase
MTKTQVQTLSKQLDDENGPRVIDLRSGDDYGAGHIPGALHVPINRLSSRPGFVPDDRPVIVYSESGGQDEQENQAVQLLKDQGIEASVLEGGYLAWVNAGLPVEI